MDPPIPWNPCRYSAAETVPGTVNFFNGSAAQAPDEDQLLAFIHHNGPVSAGINSDVFALREKGCNASTPCFITPAMCRAVPQEIDHSITITGYGTDATHGDYWEIKNSWGQTWANDGYILVSRGVGCAGMCGDPTICGNVFTHGDPSAYFE